MSGTMRAIGQDDLVKTKFCAALKIFLETQNRR